MSTNFAQDLLGCDLQGQMVNREQNSDRDFVSAYLDCGWCTILYPECL